MKRSERLRQIGIGVQLKKLRESSHMTTRLVAAALGLSSSSVSRTELGQRVPDRDEISALCALYGVTGEETRRLIERIGEAAETAGWLESGHITDDLASLMVLEREATAITNVATALIPGLAQTADYARLVLGAGAPNGEDVERRVATRLGRQAILSRPGAPAVSMLIHEGALHRTLGDARMMREQLAHLITLQRRETVSVRVIAFSSATSPANGTPFAFHTLVDGTPYVFMENPSTALFLTEFEKVQPFMQECRTLETRALDEQASVALIRKTAEGVTDD